VRSTLLASMARGNAISWGSTRARGYFVSTVGRDGAVIREYIPEARAGGPAPGSDESVALTSHRQVASRLWGRVSGPIVASSGHITKAPALPEDTYLAEQNEHDCRSDPLLTHNTRSQLRETTVGTWIKCTDERGQTIHANLDNVATLFRDDARHRGTVIAFMGGATDAMTTRSTALVGPAGVIASPSAGLLYLIRLRLAFQRNRHSCQSICC
jgi:hypothetical protein